MPMFRPTTTDYSGRQLDIELLQSVAVPVELIRVSVSSVTKQPKAVTGIQKAVQRYASALLSYLGTIHFATTYGTQLVQSILGGSVQDLGKLRGVFASANGAALTQLRSDDALTDIYGELPDDERIITATLLDQSIDYATSSVYFRVLITTAAGDEYTFVIPTATAR